MRYLPVVNLYAGWKAEMARRNYIRPHLQPHPSNNFDHRNKANKRKTHYFQSDHWHKSSRGAHLHFFHVIIYQFQLFSNTRAPHKASSSLCPGRGVRIRRSDI